MGSPDGVFEIEARQVGDVLVLSPIGELDKATAPEVDRAVQSVRGGSAIVVDLRDLTFIDATGIRALLQVCSAVSFIPAEGHVQGFCRWRVWNRSSHGRSSQRNQKWFRSPITGYESSSKSGVWLGG